MATQEEIKKAALGGAMNSTNAIELLKQSSLLKGATPPPVPPVPESIGNTLKQSGWGPTVVSPKPTTANTVTQPTVPTNQPVQGSVSSILGELGVEDPFITQYTQEQLGLYNTPIDEQAIYEKKRQENQAQIDAINALYADRLRQEQQTSQGRLGSSRAIQARSGLIGSDFGTAQTAGVQQLNREQEQSVENERLALVNQILSSAQKSAADEIAAKRLAREAGGKAYLDYLAGQQTRKQENTSRAAQLLLLNNKTPEDISDAELAQAKISRNDLRLAYSGIKSQQEAEQAKAQAESEKAQLENLKIGAEIDRLTAQTILDKVKAGELYEQGGRIYQPIQNTDGTIGYQYIADARSVTNAANQSSPTPRVVSTGDSNLYARMTANTNPIGVYATGDPDGSRHAQVYEQAKSMGLENYIAQFTGTQITADMVNSTAQKYGVDPLMIAATMGLDSSMGTKGKGARNNNPGNIGQFDSLDAQGITVKGYNTLQEGIDAVGENLQKRQKALGIENTATTSKPISSLTQGIISGVGKLKDLTPSDRANVIAEIVEANKSGEYKQQFTQYADAKKQNLDTLVDQAIKDLDKFTTGAWGRVITQKLPGTEGYDFRALIDSIKANIGFEELQAMRAASPTGGALGQVAVQELNGLQSILGSLDIGQSKSALTTTLKNIKNHISTWKDAVSGSQSTSTPPPPPPSGGETVTPSGSPSGITGRIMQ